MSTKETLKADLTKLKQIRELVASLKYDLRNKQNLFEIQNAELITRIKIMEDDESLIDGRIRETAIALFDGENKEVGYGVKIRMMTKYAYDDAMALNWAIEHKVALKLDTKAFEKISQTEQVDFVTVSKVPSAAIPSEIVLEEQ